MEPIKLNADMPQDEYDFKLPFEVDGDVFYILIPKPGAGCSKTTYHKYDILNGRREVVKEDVTPMFGLNLVSDGHYT